VIDLDLFQFAAPQSTGVDYYLRVLKAVGLEVGLPSEALEPWKEKEKSKGILRVSLVRHPLDFMYKGWQLQKKQHPMTPNFCDCMLLYVRGNCSVNVAKIYESYDANVVQRWEDCPWALIEFFDSLGIPRSLSMRARSVEKEVSVIPQLPKFLLEEFKQLEQEVYNRYDYW